MCSMAFLIRSEQKARRPRQRSRCSTALAEDTSPPHTVPHSWIQASWLLHHLPYSTILLFTKCLEVLSNTGQECETSSPTWGPAKQLQPFTKTRCSCSLHHTSCLAPSASLLNSFTPVFFSNNKISPSACLHYL